VLVSHRGPDAEVTLRSGSLLAALAVDADGPLLAVNRLPEARRATVVRPSAETAIAGRVEDLAAAAQSTPWALVRDGGALVARRVPSAR
jgi:hypothetical protein